MGQIRHGNTTITHAMLRRVISYGARFEGVCLSPFLEWGECKCDGLGERKRTFSRGAKVIAVGRLRFIEAVLYRYRTGIPWRDLPVRFGGWKNVH